MDYFEYQPNYKVRRLNNEAKEVDMISNLPIELIQIIFKYLTMKDVVKMSTLLKEWMDKWISCEHLCFDSNSLPPSSFDQIPPNHEELSRIINLTLLLHEGRISSFVINNFLQNVPAQLEQWIYALSKRSLDKLVIEFPKHDQVEVVRFPIMHLTHLKLANIQVLPLPVVSEHSCSIKIIELVRVIVDEHGLSFLIGTSPKLHTLIIDFCFGFESLSITSSSLYKFHYRGAPIKKSFTLNAPNLKIFRINIGCVRGNQAEMDFNYSDDYKLCFKQVENLALGSYFLRKWSMTGKYKPFPQFAMLKLVDVDINVGRDSEISHAFNLILRSCHLEVIKLFFYNDGNVLSSEEHEWLKQESKTSLHHVKKVEIHAFHWLPVEVSIVRHLLLLTPSLEAIDILVGTTLLGTALSEDHDVFKVEAPPKAIIRFLEWNGPSMVIMD